MLKYFPKDVLAQWAVGSVALAGAASVAYIVVFPPQEAPELPQPQAELTAPTASAPPAPGSPPDAEFAALDSVRDAAPQFDIVRVTDLGNVLVAGKAPPRVQVAALIDEAQIADTVSSGAGEFVMMFDVDPSRAPRVLELEIRLPEGGRVRSADTLMLAPSSAALSDAPEAGQGMTARPVETKPLFGAPSDPARLSLPPETAGDGPANAPVRITLPDAMTRAGPPDAPDPDIDTPTGNGGGAASPEAPSRPDIAAAPDAAQPEPGGDAPASLPSSAPAASTPAVSDAVPLALLLRADGSVQVLGDAPRLPQTGGAPDSVVIDSVVYDQEGEVVMGGRSARGLADIQIYLDNQPIIRTRADADGAWRAQLAGIDRGVYRLRVDELDAAAQVTSRAEIPFERVTPELARDAEGPRALIVQPGNTLWHMSEQKYGDGRRYMRIFDANKDQIRDPDLIYPGQVFVVPEAPSQ